LLTLEKLEKIKPGRIFAKGQTLHPRLSSRIVRWVAKKGNRKLNWVIFWDYDRYEYEEIELFGNRCFSPWVIMQLVPCTDDVLEKYIW
jgi:hypothetical protein